MFRKKPHRREGLGYRRGWFCCESYCFHSLWYVLPWDYLPFKCQSRESRFQALRDNATHFCQLHSVGTQGLLTRLEYHVLLQKNLEIFLLYTFCASLLQIYGRSRQVVRDFGFQDYGSLAKYYFIITNIHIVFYCHLWLHPFGLAGEDRVNKWSSIPIFLQTLHHFMNIWKSQASVPCVLIPLLVNKKRLINAHSPVIWELSQYHWFSIQYV